MINKKFDSFADSRDAARTTDIDLIATNLELFFTENARYPSPDDGVDIMHYGGVAWTQ